MPSTFSSRACAVVAFLASGLSGLVAATRSASADIWVLDKNTTAVHFSYDHLGVSRQWGRFKDIEGRLEFSPTEPERGEVDITIKTSAISTGVPELDKLLRSVDFFNTARFPAIRFRSTAVRPVPGREREGEIDGELTLLGVTHPVTLKARWNYTGEYPLAAINPAYAGKWLSGFSATTVIERSRWGLKRGVPLISDEVEIKVEAEFLKVD